MLRDLREQRGLTLRQTVDALRETELLQTSTATLSYYERGKIHPPTDVLKKLAKFYDTDINHVLYNRVKDLREAKGVDIKQVAQATGIKVDTLKSYETGRCVNVLTKNWEKLADYFNTSVEYVMGYDPEDNQAYKHSAIYKQLDMMVNTADKSEDDQDISELDKLRKENIELRRELESIKSRYRNIMRSVSLYLGERVGDLDVRYE